MPRTAWLLALGSTFLMACPDDDGGGSAETDDATGSGTGPGMTMSGAQGPGTADDDATPTDDGPTDDGPTDDGPTDDGPTDDGPTDDTTDGGTGCSDDGDCGGATPFCSGGACVDCSDVPDPTGACEGLDAGTPFCVGGACVQCTANDASLCEGETPLCDEGTLQCVGCSYHAQCETGACDLDTGACMPGMPEMWVRPLASNCSMLGPGTFVSPFCELQEAVDAIDAEGNIGTVRLEEGDAVLPGVTIPAGLTIAILAAEDQRPETGAIYATGSGAHVYLEGISVRNEIFDVVLAHDASLWLDRVIVYQNQGYAVDARDGAALHMRNSVVGSNGRISNLRAAVYVEDSSIDVQYSAIVGNYGQQGAISSLECVNATSASVRNSIIADSAGTSIGCAGIAIDYSFIDTAGLGGSGNEVDTSIGGDLQDWFINPGVALPGGGGIIYGDDFRLTPAGEALFGPIGLVQEGDLPFDIELNPRSTTIGDPTTAGAYLSAP